mgnify:CR=1 FL=1
MATVVTGVLLVPLMVFAQVLQTAPDVLHIPADDPVRWSIAALDLPLVDADIDPDRLVLHALDDAQPVAEAVPRLDEVADQRSDLDRALLVPHHGRRHRGHQGEDQHGHQIGRAHV